MFNPFKPALIPLAFLLAKLVDFRNPLAYSFIKITAETRHKHCNNQEIQR
jgi:hypothetical protein